MAAYSGNFIHSKLRKRRQWLSLSAVHLSHHQASSIIARAIPQEREPPAWIVSHACHPHSPVGPLCRILLCSIYFTDAPSARAFHFFPFPIVCLWLIEF